MLVARKRGSRPMVLGARQLAADSQRVARGSGGGSWLRQLYRHSPLRYARKIIWDHRGLQPHDVILASYPRSGSSWLRFLLVEMLSADSSFARIRHEAPYVGFHHGAPRLVPGGGRLIRTHEPYTARYRRAIHLVRDPRDVLVSYFRYMQRIGKIALRQGDDIDATFEVFVNAFLAGRVDAHGTWQTHLDSWSHAAVTGAAEVLRVRYEDMYEDTPASLMRIAAWIAHPLTEDDATRIAERCSLARMRDAENFAIAQTPEVFPQRDPATSVPLIGGGSVGGWHQALDQRQQARFRSMANGLALLGYEPA